MKMVVNGEEMMFLCNAFVPPESVPAIDYMLLTLAQATASMNDPQLLTSRMNVSKKVIKEIKTIARRIYRIFAFCYFMHFEEFDFYEKKTHLCERWTKFMKMYELMDKKSFYIPDSYFK
jgi:hypothetical protein